MTVTYADAGCWIDGHEGHYGIVTLVTIAETYGMRLSAVDSGAVSRYAAGSNAEIEIVHSIADEAEEFLNATVAPDGYSFGWHEGAFFLWSEESWREDW